MEENRVERPLCVKELCGIEMAEETFHFYFLPKAKCIFKD